MRSRSLRSRLRSRCSRPRSSRCRLLRSRSGLAGAPAYAGEEGIVGAWARAGGDAAYAYAGMTPAGVVGTGMGAVRGLRRAWVGDEGERERAGDAVRWWLECAWACGFDKPGA